MAESTTSPLTLEEALAAAKSVRTFNVETMEQGTASARVFFGSGFVQSSYSDLARVISSATPLQEIENMAKNVSSVRVSLVRHNFNETRTNTYELRITGDKQGVFVADDGPIKNAYKRAYFQVLGYLDPKTP